MQKIDREKDFNYATVKTMQ